jgi:trimeric autotransporter adhesin
MVEDIDPTDLTDVNGTLYFAANDGKHGEELWKSDGTATVMVKDIDPGPTGSNLFGLTNVDGTLFFAADDGTHGDELWKSDGTAAGTVMVKDIDPGSKFESCRPGGRQRGDRILRLRWHNYGTF